MGAIRISSLSTEPVRFAVSAVVNGNPYNPTQDAIQFAFMPLGRPPAASDWVNGAWVTVNGPPVQYVAECMVGPANNAVLLGLGMYVVWIKITDAPSVPVRDVGTVQVF